MGETIGLLDGNTRETPQNILLRPSIPEPFVWFNPTRREGANVENLEVTGDLVSNFLPFRGGGARFHNFALLTELLGFVVEGKELEVLLDFIGQNVLNTFSLQGLYMLKHREGEIWKVTQSNLEIDEELRLSSHHAIAIALEGGAIGSASTSGWNFGIDEPTPEIASESYRLLLIPLIDNLVPRSVLVAVIGNSATFTPADLELFAFMQAVISYVAYGSKPLDEANYDF